MGCSVNVVWHTFISLTHQTSAFFFFLSRLMFFLCVFSFLLLKKRKDGRRCPWNPSVFCFLIKITLLFLFKYAFNCKEVSSLFHFVSSQTFNTWGRCRWMKWCDTFHSSTNPNRQIIVIDWSTSALFEIFLFCFFLTSNAVLKHTL